ncbi:MAG: 50S ribosomal protein L24e [Nanoarchaeales archaeon]|nr:50S ribosomal protein L24e [Nanoarchaeales archaeon]
MVKCTFCDAEVQKGFGKIFVRDNGQVLNFCALKCEKNMLVLKRDARKLKWTGFYQKGGMKANLKK